MANADADKSADKSEESACEKAKNSYLRSLIGTWDFPAHRLTDDDLAQCAFLIFEHAFTMPEVESLVLTRHQLKRFLFVLRRSYQPINPYHNFRHVVDVLQATFYFLLCMHAIPPLPPSASFPSPPSSASPTAPSSTPTSFASSSETSPAPQKSLSVLLTPIDALALLVTAIGHDVGHPGVTNSFLISARSPLARIYSDRSVLESFHCAAFSQILHRYWPAVHQQLEIKGIMVESVLATDMAMHNEYMQKITAVVKAISEGGDVVVEGDGGYRKRLLCASLIKCADISNVARIMDISTHWGTVLTEEFKNMADLELRLGLKQPPPSQPATTTPSSELTALAKGQLFFINTFAYPFFETVGKGVPEIEFAAEQIRKNKAVWDQTLSNINGGV
ncbi:hypothetical protein BZA70DRAFT_237117 [Myxozyma melibiosi]|uniref:PDEase domain-containing protein n=1 Tax=Myxozyma melibiosi TaxID=54550 RepID=A0ABR1F8F6_9ASCO